MSDDFLSRWSRRKEMAHRAGRGAEPPTGERAAPPEPHAAEGDLGPEEIARLPKIDELTADSDITGFLRRGVPEGLRNAALRKMWTLDPAIRDFVGHARDYAYDWNTPGGVPGSGALAPGDDVAAMVRRVLGEPEAGDKAGDHGGATPPDEAGHAEPARQESAGEEGNAAAMEEEAGAASRSKV